jgi:hypothetical protein
MSERNCECRKWLKNQQTVTVGLTPVPLAPANDSRRTLLISAPIAPAGNFVSISFESDPTATVGLTLTVGANPLLLKHEDFGPALLGTVRAVSSVAGATVSYLEILDPSMHAR